MHAIPGVVNSLCSSSLTPEGGQSRDKEREEIVSRAVEETSHSRHQWSLSATVLCMSFIKSLPKAETVAATGTHGRLDDRHRFYLTTENSTR